MDHEQMILDIERITAAWNTGNMTADDAMKQIRGIVFPIWKAAANAPSKPSQEARAAAAGFIGELPVKSPGDSN
jgi:hypothetical protein